VSNNQADKLNPGSDAAIAQGCTCPILDNARGKGTQRHGTTVFWITAGCPLHNDGPSPQQLNRKDG
jgi:hypothetical protein